MKSADFAALGGGVIAIAIVIAVYVGWLHVVNATIVALTLLLIVLVIGATARLWVAAATSLVAMLALNFFVLPPVGTLRIADPQNWVALFVFLAVSLIASNLSAAARARTQDALDRQRELGRLFDLSRDVLLTTDSAEALSRLARSISERFALDFVAICLPGALGWEVHRAGTAPVTLDDPHLQDAFAQAQHAAGAGAALPAIEWSDQAIRIVPLMVGARAVGLLAAAGRPVERATLDALAGVAAIAIERAQLLQDREAAEATRQREELKSTLLASLAHDLRTPLTAIRVAASNLQSAWLKDANRREQSEVILAEVERLHRLFQNILDMARIDAGAVAVERQWVHPSQIVEAARNQVEAALRRHDLETQFESDVAVNLDPRLTAAALAHVLENAAQYSPPASPIALTAAVSPEGLTFRVRDRGPGIAAADLPHLFERFYRGAESKQRIGTGMGLSIARGMLAAEGGRIWSENCSDGGARFTLVIPADQRSVMSLEPAS